MMTELYQTKQEIAGEFHFDPTAQVKARIQNRVNPTKYIDSPIKGKGHHLPVNPNSAVPPYAPDEILKEVWAAKEEVSKNIRQEIVA